MDQFGTELPVKVSLPFWLHNSKLFPLIIDVSWYYVYLVCWAVRRGWRSIEAPIQWWRYNICHLFVIIMITFWSLESLTMEYNYALLIRNHTNHLPMDADMWNSQYWQIVQIRQWSSCSYLIFTLYVTEAVGYGDPLVAVLPSFHGIE